MISSIHIISGTALHRSFSLREGEQFIGREQGVDIQIPSKEISRKHAKIVVRKNQVAIVDLQSSNGTIVNGKRVNSKALKHRDRIILGDVILEFRDEEKYSAEHFDGGKTLYHQATQIMSSNFRPRNLWPFFFLFFALAFCGSTWVMHGAYHRLLVDRLSQSAAHQAQSLTRYLAEKNREDLKLKNHLLLDVSSVTSEPGVIEASIINRNGRVLAPTQKSDQSDQSPFVMEAINHTSNELMLPGPRNSKGHQVFVHPVRIYDDRVGKYVNLGVVKIVFSTKKAIGKVQETRQMLYLMLLGSLILSMILSWLVSKSLSVPILKLAEKIQRWRTGQIYQKEPAPFKDWDPLYQAVERAIEEAER